MRLPFEKRRKGDWSVWIYQHRVGLMVTVVIYLVAAILFMSYRIILNPDANYSMMIELVNPQEKTETLTPEEQEAIKEIERIEEVRYERAMNRISNQNAEMNSGLKDDRGTRASDIYKDAERVQRELAAGKAAYEKSMADLEAMEKPKDQTPQSNRGESETRQDVLVKGNVTVSFNLEGRTGRYLHIPAYQCQGGGEVTIGITVNRSGKVIAASVDRATSTNDPCITDMAVQSALASSFSASSSAPEKQKGTITYLFVPQ